MEWIKDNKNHNEETCVIDFMPIDKVTLVVKKEPCKDTYMCYFKNINKNIKWGWEDEDHKIVCELKYFKSIEDARMEIESRFRYQLIELWNKFISVSEEIFKKGDDK